MGVPVLAQAPLTAASADDALAYANTLPQAASRALDDALAAVILHGSLTLGDYLPGRSDIDLLLIVDDSPSDAHLAGLAKAVGHQQPRAPFRVDLRVVTRTVAGGPTPLPPMDAYLRIKGPERRVHIEGRDRGERDLAVEFSVCRAHGRSLLGSPPSELIGRVPDRWVLDAGDAQLADWQTIGDDPPYAQLTVLSACRVWRFAEERRHSSKDATGSRIAAPDCGSTCPIRVIARLRPDTRQLLLWTSCGSHSGTAQGSCSSCEAAVRHPVGPRLSGGPGPGVRRSVRASAARSDRSA